MAVTETIVIPAQPTDGLIKYTAMGGDGFRSPIHLCRFLVKLAADASGGQLTIDLRMPDDFVSVVSWIRAVQDDATPVACQIQLRPDNATQFQGSFSLARDNINGSSTAFHAETLWVPPAILMEQEDSATISPSITIAKANVDTFELDATGEIYLYDKRIRELGQAQDLFALIGRGGSSFQVQ